MTTLMEALSPHEVANRVRPYVARPRIGDIDLHIDDSLIHLRNGYWHIPIRPSRWPEVAFPYCETLADIEEDVQENEDLKVSIDSGDPLTEL